MLSKITVVILCISLALLQPKQSSRLTIVTSWALWRLSAPGEVTGSVAVSKPYWKLLAVVHVVQFWQMSGFWGIQSILIVCCLEDRGLIRLIPPTGQGLSELRTQSHENDTATWKVIPFGNGRVKMKGLFKSVLCLLIPAVMYGLGSKIRCSLQQFPGNYRALTSKPASWEAQSRCCCPQIVFPLWGPIYWWCCCVCLAVCLRWSNFI